MEGGGNHDNVIPVEISAARIAAIGVKYPISRDEPVTNDSKLMAHMARLAFCQFNGYQIP
jgi:hypothetical protein